MRVFDTTGDLYDTAHPEAIITNRNNRDALHDVEDAARRGIHVMKEKPMAASLTIADAMQTRFRTIMSGDNLQRAANMLLDGSQQDFPVVERDSVVGILAHRELFSALRGHGDSEGVANVMRREFAMLTLQYARPDPVYFNSGSRVRRPAMTTIFRSGIRRSAIPFVLLAAV